ncbi:MAG: hypothetical protein AUK03_15790 [Anaerolineae bacterium CG2_30_64_16]|nr:MAG: hypothetical protein AUK03_15790 [Anaerolineae bacterium CG2_30_64_16]
MTSLDGKLDTGAGISVLPLTAVKVLGLKSKTDVWVAGYDGLPTQTPAYVVTVTVAGHTVEALTAIATPRSQILIGRDVLSHFVATFDGKNQTFDLVDP